MVSQLSATEIASLACRLLFLFPLVLPFNILRTCLLAASRGLNPLRHYPTVGIYRTLLTTFTHRQAQSLLPLSSKAYTKWMVAKHKGYPPSVASKVFTVDIDPVPGSAASLLWIGDRKTATKFVLLAHGGGFYLPLDKGHLEWALQCFVQGTTERSLETSDVAVAMLDYSLAPGAVYPAQLIEASQAAKYLLSPREGGGHGIPPGRLLVGGDSAGGTITAGLVSHLGHAHPRAEGIELAEPLAGVFLVSPWVGGCLGRQAGLSSWRENGKRDMLTIEVIRGLEKMVFEGTEWERERMEGKGWGLPLDVDASWLEGVESVVRKVYVTVGELEVMRDQGVECARRLEKVGRGSKMEVVLDVLEGQAHEFIVLEAGAGKGGPALGKMSDWVKSAFGV
ncbi:Alpha/Beta hydrolase protein [Cercophora newfieldiana]|uniref:Alpha/Beta hydrolase protein n=1 Tax=Cercophora newfieldiana TaxID=92897 RepID=A0AA39XXU7_9PEZI|nr:Alpha/Beta hydrolase protein [Cercophora newfieldiana]